MNERELGWLIRDKYPDFFSAPGWRRHYAKLIKDVLRLMQGEPIAYVIGWIDFLGARIDLSQKPLIPRTETEFWTMAAILEIKKSEASDRRSVKTLKVLDLCAGSGAIGLAILKECKNVHATLADVAKNAIGQIKINADLNHIPQRTYKIIKSDLFQKIEGRFDFIFVNPPYVPSGRVLPRSVAKFEPHQALFSGKDGLKMIQALLSDAHEHLKPDGKMYLEFDLTQKQRIAQAAKRFGWRAEFHKDQFGKWRWVVLTLANP